MVKNIDIQFVMKIIPKVLDVCKCEKFSGENQRQKAYEESLKLNLLV